MISRVMNSVFQGFRECGTPRAAGGPVQNTSVIDVNWQLAQMELLNLLKDRLAVDLRQCLARLE
jgi:hypothetical protein